jgi:phosphoribosylformylglycinamidine synthase PurS subunit
LNAEKSVKRTAVIPGKAYATTASEALSEREKPVVFATTTWSGCIFNRARVETPTIRCYAKANEDPSWFQSIRPMKARVTVTLKTGILDPQGKAIEGALKSLGVAGVASVRQGKVFDIEIEGGDKAKAEAALKSAAEKLLANTVIENYRIEVIG